MAVVMRPSSAQQQQQMNSPFADVEGVPLLPQHSLFQSSRIPGVLDRLLCFAARVAPAARSASAPAVIDAMTTPGAREWQDLPQEILETILGLVLEPAKLDRAARKDLFAAASVCKQWRSTCFRRFFLQPWFQPDDIIHPLQLLSLSGRAVTGNLLRCFVRREATPRRGLGAARYSFYLGTAHQQLDTCKFLLAALQTSRREILIFLDRQCEGRPIARLNCSVLQMGYRIETLDACALPFVDMLTRPDGGLRRWGSTGLSLPRRGSRADIASSEVQLARLPPVLAEVRYHMRLKGFMRPRKMRVTLPHPMELTCFDVEASRAVQRLASVCGTCPLPDPDPQPSSSLSKFKRSASGPLRALTDSLGRGRVGSALTGASSAPPNAALDAAAEAAMAAIRSGEAAPAPLPSERLPLGLRNKQPHWNDNLRCHCLNFHGRVKEASVKNFQLVCTDAALAAALNAAAEPPPGGARPSATRAARSVAMQFGKVEGDVYILDYNPTVVTGLQAFCIALTNFDCHRIV